jgi:anthranilate synthase component 1
MADSDARVVRRDLPGGRPDFLKAHAAYPDRLPFLLESASHGTAIGRYDVLMLADADALLLDGAGHLHGVGAEAGSFLQALDAWHARERVAPQTDGLPFAGGWFLYFGYEFASDVEPRLRLPAGPAPRAYARRVRTAAVWDHATAQLSLVHERGADEDAQWLASVLEPMAGPTPLAALPALSITEDDPEHYRQAVRRARDYIAAGDIYQANLAREWRVALPPTVTPEQLYAHLRQANPGPFAALARLPGTTVLSTSPERLVASRGGRVESRPIAGTRARRGDDEAVIRELMENVKERAEHVMLVDLERNDLGRISVGGSVRVDEYMVVESYAHVHHIVSNVVGELRPGTTPGEIVRALFPGGTITGCPKVRCMELIAELEGRPRGAYTGSLGYLGCDGRMDLNILIRTAMVSDRDGARELSILAGAGIVADSDPQRELDETRAKARGLLRALGALEA